jgi:hypothetical protein
MARHSADGDGMALSLAHLAIDLTDVLGLPGGVVALADDDVRGFDVPPLRCGMLREKPTLGTGWRACACGRSGSCRHWRGRWGRRRHSWRAGLGCQSDRWIRSLAR